MDGCIDQTETRVTSKKSVGSRNGLHGSRLCELLFVGVAETEINSRGPV